MRFHQSIVALKEVSFLNGRYTDLEVYRMLEQEWQARDS